MKKIILIAAGGVLVTGIGVGAALFLLGGEEEVAMNAEGGDVASEAVDTSSKEPPIYVGLDPDFVVAFQNPKHARFIKASLEVMTRDKDVEDAIKLHMPVIRDSVLMLFSMQNEDELASREGKEQFRAEILAEVQKVIEEHTGNPGVEAVYFTNLVMQ
jgi:flagellar FliL protein